MMIDKKRKINVDITEKNHSKFKKKKLNHIKLEDTKNIKIKSSLEKIISQYNVWTKSHIVDLMNLFKENFEIIVIYRNDLEKRLISHIERAVEDEELKNCAFCLSKFINAKKLDHQKYLNCIIREYITSMVAYCDKVGIATDMNDYSITESNKISFEQAINYQNRILFLLYTIENINLDIGDIFTILQAILSLLPLDRSDISSDISVFLRKITEIVLNMAISRTDFIRYLTMESECHKTLIKRLCDLLSVSNESPYSDLKLFIWKFVHTLLVKLGTLYLRSYEDILRVLFRTLKDILIDKGDEAIHIELTKVLLSILEIKFNPNLIRKLVDDCSEDIFIIYESLNYLIETRDDMYYVYHILHNFKVNFNIDEYEINLTKDLTSVEVNSDDMEEIKFETSLDESIDKIVELQNDVEMTESIKIDVEISDAVDKNEEEIMEDETVIKEVIEIADDNIEQNCLMELEDPEQEIEEIFHEDKVECEQNYEVSEVREVTAEEENTCAIAIDFDI